MLTPRVRSLMRLFTTAFVLLLASSTDGHAHVVAHRHHSSRRVVAAANVSAALPATAAQKHVDSGPLPLLASEPAAQDTEAQSAPAPARESSSLCSCEHTTGEAARPPPFQS
jgi:hypothetical protein